MIDTDVLSGGGTPAASSNFKVENSTIAEPFITGSAESATYGIYGEFQETLGTSPDAPTALQQYRGNGTTIVATGEWLGANAVVFKFTMTDPDPSNFLRPQIEVRSTTDAFTGQVSFEGAEIPYAGGVVTGVVTVNASLADNTAYHWQARAIDDENRYSPWVSFGANPETAMDFGIDTSPPYVLVFTPNGGETLAATSVYNITWEAYDTGSGVAFISIFYSINNGASWIMVSTNEANDGTYSWTVPNTPTNEALVKVEAFNNLGNMGFDTSDNVFRIVGPLFPPALLTGEALPVPPPTGPDHVRLYWTSSTSEAYTGYYVYRGTSFGVYNSTPISGLVTTDTYDDYTVSPNTDYYYAVKTYGNGAYSPYSNCATAPLMSMTRFFTVKAPISGGYTGGVNDSVPGATIMYTMQYKNIGYGPAQQILINDKVPQYTNYKIGSATGEAVKVVTFYSTADGWSHTPAGTYIDTNVTGVSWEVNDISSGVSKLCTYEVIIR